MKTTATILLSLCLTLAVQAEIRIWKDASGTHEIKAELVGVQGGKVTLKRENGTTITLPVTSLSKADQALLGGGSGGSGAAAGDWPQWRGPNRDDVSTETGLLKKWPASGPKRAWVSQEAGLGYSGFAVSGGKIYTMGLYDAEEKVVCLDAATGKKVWDSFVGAIYKNKWGDGPRCTPTVAGGKVYAIGGNGDLVCLDAATGKQDWSKSLVKDLGGKVQGWGYTESPLVEGDLVIVTPGGGQGAIAALSTKSGKVEWQTKDVTENAQYSSIIPIDHGGQRQYVQLLMKTILGVSKEGKVLWQTDFPGQTAVIPTPIYSDGQVYVTAGYGVGCKAVKLGAGSAEEVYANKNMENHHGGVVLVNGLLYGHSNNGGWTCQDFKTGEVVWQDKGVGKGAVAYADGMLYCQSENDGTIALVETSKKGWNMVSSFKLEAQTSQRAKDGRIWTHPVVVGGKLYLRDQEFISCYDVKG
ncbi:MAG: PQQ-binding-like beta-propeller repeat protein [Prosthecobacter sp.]|uniref:outer membrane protein assembly factor BamB family protein n=1 Tax=Prosthecobacter sp. TaxID=1965333 RepID=UPI003903827F